MGVLCPVELVRQLRIDAYLRRRDTGKKKSEEGETAGMTGH